jgi:hypothetical protein
VVQTLLLVSGVMSPKMDSLLSELGQALHPLGLSSHNIGEVRQQWRW